MKLLDHKQLLMGAMVAVGLAGCGEAYDSDLDVDLDVAASRNDEDRIVGGSNTTIELQPWQISLQSSSGSHFCGGTIISPTWILTAAHCVDGSSANSMRVVAGITRRSEASSIGQIRSIQSIYVYSGYTSPDKGKDAALLKLSSPLDLSGAKAKAIPIMTAAAASGGATNAGVLARVTGWGTLSSGGSSLPDVLQAVELPIISNALAQQAYSSETITSDQLAAGVQGVGGKDSCQGDSGGPFTVNTAQGRALAGIVSWGYGCGDASYPGMYSRVSSFETWILGQTDAVGIGGSTPQPDPQPQPQPQPGELLSVSNLSGAKSAWLHHTLSVPAGATTLVVEMSGGLGDADLYVRAGSQPTTTTYVCRPYLGGNQETCTITAPAAGTWYASVRGYTSFSGVQLRATVVANTTPQPQPTGYLELTNLSAAQGGWLYYHVTPAAGAATVQVTISGGNGDADLYVRWGSQPTTSTYTCRPYVSGNNETCDVPVASGDLHIGIRAYTSFSGVNLSAQ